MQQNLALVTGCNQGFGYALVDLLLRKGFEVVMACRNKAAAESAAQKLISSASNSPGKIVVMKLDLSDLNSVVAFAKEFQEKYNNRSLKYLVLNAGIMKMSRELSQFDIETTYLTNHIAGAALFNLLLKDTIIPSKTRVVAVSSVMHTMGTFKVGDDITGKALPYDLTKWYSNSKLFNALWGFQVQKRYSSVGVTCNSLHPGSGLFTNLGREDASPLFRAIITPFLYFISPFAWLFGMAQTWHQGGVAELAACEAAKGGQYLWRHRPYEACKTAKDEELQNYLWDETRRVLQDLAQKYSLPKEIAGFDL